MRFFSSNCRRILKVFNPSDYEKIFKNRYRLNKKLWIYKHQYAVTIFSKKDNTQNSTNFNVKYAICITKCLLICWRYMSGIALYPSYMRKKCKGIVLRASNLSKNFPSKFHYFDKWGDLRKISTLNQFNKNIWILCFFVSTFFFFRFVYGIHWRRPLSICWFQLKGNWKHFTPRRWTSCYLSITDCIFSCLTFSACNHW